jgi:polyphosphate kinase
LVLYRTDADGRLINLLIKAAERKKQVACIIELKARFDEESNIKWAHILEEAGVHVAYGILKFKTHAKLALVVREEESELKTYVNIGTGNFNGQTSRLYTDLSYFTCRPKIVREVLEVFNHLTGLSLEGSYKNLLVAPFNMSQTFEKQILREVKNKQAGRPARIIAKMNSLQDPKLVKALYNASSEGVPITLFVRGFCCLRPGITGLSENIKVFSIIGRFLEHSRIFHFANGQELMEQGTFFIGSADWMYRNLYERLEVATPIIDKELKVQLTTILQACQNDNTNCWELGSEGRYKKLSVPKNQKKSNSHQFFLNKYCKDE